MVQHGLETIQWLVKTQTNMSTAFKPHRHLHYIHAAKSLFTWKATFSSVNSIWIWAPYLVNHLLSLSTHRVYSVTVTHWPSFHSSSLFYVEIRTKICKFHCVMMETYILQCASCKVQKRQQEKVTGTPLLLLFGSNWSHCCYVAIKLVITGKPLSWSYIYSW